MRQSLLTRRIGIAARLLTAGNPKLVITPEALRDAARIANLPLTEPLERSPVAIAVGFQAVTRLEKRRSVRPTKALIRLRREVLDAAFRHVEAIAA